MMRPASSLQSRLRRLSRGPDRSPGFVTTRRPRSTSGATRSSTRSSISRSSRPSTSTSTSIRASAKASTSPRAWPSAGTPGSSGCSDHQLRGRQPLVLYASHPDFEQTNTIQGELGEGTGGVTEPLRRRIILPLGGPLADTDHVIGHELVHAFQFDITTRPESRARARRAPSGCRCGSSRAWRNTCRSGRSTPTRRCGCATPRDEGDKLPDDRRARQPEVLPVSLGPGVLGVRRRQVGRRRHRQMLRDRRGDRRHRRSRSSGCSASRRRSCPRSGTPRFAARTNRSCAATHAAERDRDADVIKGEKLGGDLNVGPGHQPRRPVDRVSLRAQPLLDRSLRRRRGDRQGRATS